MAEHLRYLTSIELFINAQYYSTHPLIEQQHNKGAYSCRGNAFAMCLSDNALNTLSKNNPSEAVIAEARNNANNYEYSSFICVLALSNVLKLPIESYYPIPLSSDGSNEVIDNHGIMFNSTVFPRDAEQDMSERVHIFRCAMMPISYLKSTKIPEKKDHYVALCRPKTVPTSEHLPFAITPSSPFVVFDPIDSPITDTKPGSQPPGNPPEKPAQKVAKPKMKQVLLNKSFRKKGS